VFFIETLPLSLPLDTARQRLNAHPNFASVLTTATIAALGNSAPPPTSWLPDPAAVRVECLPARLRDDAMVVALRWLTRHPAAQADVALLDADLELQPDGAHGARLALAGRYSDPYSTDRPDPRHPEQREALQTAAQTLLRHCAVTLTASAG
jgi:hypothetical protein